MPAGRAARDFDNVFGSLVTEFWMDRGERELLDSDIRRAICTDYLHAVHEAGTQARVAQRKQQNQPFTLILEKERIAVPGRGLPIHVAGRKVVKMSMFLT